ncbi:MAG TPA: hypothetical protein VKC58_11030 [Myxococcales bacterium]|jgi:hypothetical protein|nr:hypothetical protein [Myxococcales bacterium]
MKVVFAFLAVLAADSGPDAGPAPAASRARITVRAIAATSGAEGTDPKLSPIARNLAEFAKDFRWRTFRLLTEQTFELAWQDAAQVELPGSRSVQVTPRQLSPDGRIKVHLELLGEHPAHARKLHTDYSIERGGTIFVGGLRLDPAKPDAGMLLVAITQGAE